MVAIDYLGRKMWGMCLSVCVHERELNRILNI